MKKHERDRIRKYWNKPAAPVRCVACGKERDYQTGPACGTIEPLPCPHCGSREGYSFTFMTGTPERDATTDINALLDALESK